MTWRAAHTASGGFTGIFHGYFHRDPRYLLLGNTPTAEPDPSWDIFGNRRTIGVAHYEAGHPRGALDLMRPGGPGRRRSGRVL